MKFLKYFFKNKKHKVIEFLNRGAIIIDVRTEREWNEDHISNAIHFPLNTLKNHIKEIKSINKPIVVHCKSGARSAIASKLLKAHKIEVINGGGIADLKLLIT